MPMLQQALGDTSSDDIFNELNGTEVHRSATVCLVQKFLFCYTEAYLRSLSSVYRDWQ